MKTFRFTVLLLVVLFACSALAQDPADRLLQDGTQLLQRKRFDEAYKAFEKANKMRGEKCYVCLLKMGYAKMLLQDEKGALKLIAKSLENAADQHERADALAVRGEIQLFFAADNQKKLAEAEQSFRDAIKEEPKGAFLHQRLGLALLRQSKDDEGKKELQAYLELAPSGKDADAARVWIADPRRARLQFAPDFTVTTLDGKTFTLSQFTGKVVLIDFWGTWCPPCRASIPELQEMFKKYPAERLVILSVSSDQEEAKWKKFVADHNMGWYQYIDLDKHVLNAYNVHSFPTYVLVDRDGVIRERISGLNEQQTLAGRLKDPLKKLLAPEEAVK